MRSSLTVAGVLVLIASAVATRAARPVADPLPSWRDGAARAAITEFVRSAVDPGSSGYIPPDERIATFDNDGTLWVEQPVYTQLRFAVDSIRAQAENHPEWRTTQPFKAALEGDRETLAALDTHDLMTLLLASHANMTTEEFRERVTQWLATARHPRFDRPYTELVYQPMLELLDLLRANGFRVFIVTGGGIEFVRVLAPSVYGIPTDQVIGSSLKTTYEVRDGRGVIDRLPEIGFIDDGPGKPVGINAHIGKRPAAAFGNSDGDLEMLQYGEGRLGSFLGMLVHHDDAEREYAYDREGSIGTLDRGFEMARANGWIIVSMRDDWRRIFPWSASTVDDDAATRAPVGAGSGGGT